MPVTMAVSMVPAFEYAAWERLAAWFAELRTTVEGMGYREQRLALAALGVRVAVGQASDVPRWRITMEIDAAGTSDAAQDRGQAPDAPLLTTPPLVLQWTDRDETEPMAAD
jgi:hypothetical protein